MNTLNNVLCFPLSTALAMGLCVAMIAFVRLPSLKVSCLLLSGLLIYDVFWVWTTNLTCITAADTANTLCIYMRRCLYNKVWVSSLHKIIMRYNEFISAFFYLLLTALGRYLLLLRKWWILYSTASCLGAAWLLVLTSLIAIVAEEFKKNYQKKIKG